MSQNDLVKISKLLKSIRHCDRLELKSQEPKLLGIASPTTGSAASPLKRRGIAEKNNVTFSNKSAGASRTLANP